MSELILDEEQKAAISAFLESLEGVLNSGLKMFDVAYFLMKATSEKFDAVGLKLYIGSSGKGTPADDKPAAE